MSLDKLRQAIGEAPVTLGSIEAIIGAQGIRELRRFYFPRWRPSRSYAPGESLRAFRTVIVSDRFEADVVYALAPPSLRVSVRLDRPAAGRSAGPLPTRELTA